MCRGFLMWRRRTNKYNLIALIYESQLQFLNFQSSSICMHISTGVRKMFDYFRSASSTHISFLYSAVRSAFDVMKTRAAVKFFLLISFRCICKCDKCEENLFSWWRDRRSVAWMHQQPSAVWLPLELLQSVIRVTWTYNFISSLTTLVFSLIFI